MLVDLSAAFDTIDRELMLNRLSNIGVEGTALKWFSSYLQDRLQSVSISGSTSKSMPPRFGVPQGSVLGPFLFTQYTVAIGMICRRHGVGYKLYAYDTQVYITFKEDSIIDQQTALARTQACIEEICIWMILHKLMMNDSKTEFVIVVSSDSVDKVSIDTITIGDSSVPPSESARNIVVIFDKTLCLKDHITKVCQTRHYWLKNIRRIRRCLSLTATQLLVLAIVLSRLDYCNDLYVGLHQQQLGRLQRIQNAAARLITCTPRQEHILITCFDAAALVKSITADYF